jgi:hypothetical protein
MYVNSSEKQIEHEELSPEMNQLWEFLESFIEALCSDIKLISFTTLKNLFIELLKTIESFLLSNAEHDSNDTLITKDLYYRYGILKCVIENDLFTKLSQESIPLHASYRHIEKYQKKILQTKPNTNQECISIREFFNEGSLYSVLVSSS